MPDFIFDATPSRDDFFKKLTEKIVKVVKWVEKITLRIISNYRLFIFQAMMIYCVM